MKEQVGKFVLCGCSNYIAAIEKDSCGFWMKKDSSGVISQQILMGVSRILLYAKCGKGKLPHDRRGDPFRYRHY